MTDAIKPYPVLLHFSAAWCGPCRAMEPAVKDLVVKNNNKMAYDKMDVDQRPEMAEAHNVRAVPTFIVFKDVDGEWVEVDRMVGGKSATALEAWVEGALARVSKPIKEV